MVEFHSVENGYKVTGVDNVVDKIVFSDALSNVWYTVTYYKLYVKDPTDKAIAKIVFIELVKKQGMAKLAEKFNVDVSTIWRNYHKKGTRISPRLTKAVLKTYPTIEIKKARVILQACRNEYLVQEWLSHNE